MLTSLVTVLCYFSVISTDFKHRRQWLFARPAVSTCVIRLAGGNLRPGEAPGRFGRTMATYGARVSHNPGYDCMGGLGCPMRFSRRKSAPTVAH